jgi:predicted DNA-binding protein (MmcQ/YjbR family)
VTEAEVARLALAQPAAAVTVQWGGSQVFKVGEKMFAVLGLGGGLSIKVSEIAFAALTESGRARPAPYLARAGWVRFDDLDDLDPEETEAWMAQAHALVSARLTRKVRRGLGLESG